MKDPVTEFERLEAQKDFILNKKSKKLMNHIIHFVDSNCVPDAAGIRFNDQQREELFGIIRKYI